MQKKQPGRPGAQSARVAPDRVPADAVEAAHDPVFDRGELPLGVGRELEGHEGGLGQRVHRDAASTIVPCRPERSSAESASDSPTAANAPANEAAVTDAAPDKNRIPNAAPALAPEDTPMTSGEARRLRKTVW